MNKKIKPYVKLIILVLHLKICTAARSSSQLFTSLPQLAPDPLILYICTIENVCSPRTTGGSGGVAHLSTVRIYFKTAHVAKTGDMDLDYVYKSSLKSVSFANLSLYVESTSRLAEANFNFTKTKLSMRIYIKA